MAERPQFQDTKSPDFRVVYSTGVFGGLNPDDAKLTYFLDRVEIKTHTEPLYGEQKVDKIVREALVEVHMTPTQWKRVALWMMQNVMNYETVFGMIPMEPKRIVTSSEPTTNSKTDT